MTKHKHHYLSCFYLAGFTPSGTRSDLLYITSKVQGRTWRDQAEDVGHKRDLFRPENESLDPDAIEDGFADVENQVAPVLKEVIDRRTLPVDLKKRALLLHLPALNASRPPAEIHALEDTVDTSMRSMIADALTPEVHAEVLAKWISEGKDPSRVRDREGVVARIRQGRVRVRFNKDTVLVGILQRSARLVDLLRQRQWNLLISESAEPDFITSDRPVSLLNNINLPTGTAARFDDPRFDVLMPLAKDLCLIGRPDGRQIVGNSSAQTVRFINTVTAAGAAEYIFSLRESLVVSGSPHGTDEEAQAYRRDLCYDE